MIAMSSRIRLAISHLPARDDPSATVTRLLCRVSFGTWNGFSETYWAIVDTGAPTSLIPYDVWQECRVLKLKEGIIRGIIDKPGCNLGVITGAIKCVLEDEEGISDELVIRADLAPVNTVPLLLGFTGVLGRAQISFDSKAGAAGAGI